ncbi:MAG: PHP domain-containing protein [Oscillospiraceae bacterium]|nr:PHP domain-containing protein [Oscillospiraceae bacterium]
MIINSDFHIHSEYSYDASLPLSEIAENAKSFGFRKIGITDHVNFNDKSFLGDLASSAKGVGEFRKTHPEIILGVELTPIEKPEFDYIAKRGTREGYIPPVSEKLYEIELAVTKEQLIEHGVRYAIGAAHWRVDVPNGRKLPADRDAEIREWYRQQMWLANDPRVTVLGHPWWNPSGVWYEDFSVIPRSMHMDIAESLLKNKKYVEYNSSGLFDNKSEKFRMQYAEFIRELFEMGIPVTYGSDSHKQYIDKRTEVEKVLYEVGFREGDFSEIRDEDLWVAEV